MSDERKTGYLNIDSSLYKTRISKKFESRKTYSPFDPGIIKSIIPGTIIEIFTTVGSDVKKGEDLMIIDAMKMQNRLKCPANGRVKAIMVNKGSRVSKGTILLELE